MAHRCLEFALDRRGKDGWSLYTLKYNAQLLNLRKHTNEDSNSSGLGRLGFLAIHR